MNKCHSEEIQDWVERHFGFRPEAAWIAHCKIIRGLDVENAHVCRQARLKPCPPDKHDAIISETKARRRPVQPKKRRLRRPE
jgi:hypothetical protein